MFVCLFLFTSGVYNITLGFGSTHSFTSFHDITTSVILEEGKAGIKWIYPALIGGGGIFAFGLICCCCCKKRKERKSDEVETTL